MSRVMLLLVIAVLVGIVLGQNLNQPAQARTTDVSPQILHQLVLLNAEIGHATYPTVQDDLKATAKALGAGDFEGIWQATHQTCIAVAKYTSACGS